MCHERFRGVGVHAEHCLRQVKEGEATLRPKAGPSHRATQSDALVAYAAPPPEKKGQEPPASLSTTQEAKQPVPPTARGEHELRAMQPITSLTDRRGRRGVLTWLSLCHGCVCACCSCEWGPCVRVSGRAGGAGGRPRGSRSHPPVHAHQRRRRARYVTQFHPCTLQHTMPGRRRRRECRGWLSVSVVCAAARARQGALDGLEHGHLHNFMSPEDDAILSVLRTLVQEGRPVEEAPLATLRQAEGHKARLDALLSQVHHCSTTQQRRRGRGCSRVTSPYHKTFVGCVCADQDAVRECAGGARGGQPPAGRAPPPGRRGGPA